MNYLDRVEGSAEFIKSRINAPVEYAVLLGSGFSLALPGLEDEIRLNYSEVPFFPAGSVKGQIGQIRYGSFGAKKVLFLCGRFHLYQGFSIIDVAMPIMVAAKLGVKLIVLTNAAGGINSSFKPGDIMLIKDHINFMGENPLVGFRHCEFADVFVDMSNAYPKHLQQKFIESAKNAGYSRDIKHGVYIGVKGPSYETPAEIEFFAKVGADAVGMSTIPEVIMAVYKKMEVLGVSIISNMAAGISSSALHHDEVLQVVSRTAGEFFRILKEFFHCV